MTHTHILKPPLPYKITLIVAMDNASGIGKNNQLPWHLPEDLQFFKRQTMHKVILMGRNTWESLPKKPLPGRRNIILTQQKDYEVAEDVVVYHNLQAALNAHYDDELMVIGGAQIYQTFLPYADMLLVTQIDGYYDCDAFFPLIDEEEWQLQREELLQSAQTGLHYRHKYYQRC